MDNRVEIKSVDDDKIVVAGYGVVFGGKDCSITCRSSRCITTTASGRKPN